MATLSHKAELVIALVVLALLALGVSLYPAIWKVTGQNAAGLQTRENRITGKRQVYIKDAGWRDESNFQKKEKETRGKDQLR